MGADAVRALQPRKTPIQARSTATVEAITEATIQVLLAVGPDRLTTTRVAHRAGVSVGTLYQYYPNKQSLLFNIMEMHLESVTNAVVQACEQHHGSSLRAMIRAVVNAFVEAKMRRADVSMALYAIASDFDSANLLARNSQRTRAALSAMLATAPGVHFEQLPFTTLMISSAMAGTTRAVLEAGASTTMVSSLREHLMLLCAGYLRGASSNSRNGTTRKHLVT